MDIYSMNRSTLSARSRHSGRAIAGLSVLGLVLAITAVQFFQECIMSFKAFNLIKGLNGSPWVGFENYRVFFSNLANSNVIANTILYNCLFAGYVFLLACLGGLFVHVLPKRSIARDTLAVLTLLPLFLPAQVYTMWFMNLFGSLPFINAGSALMLIPFLAALKYAGVPILVTHILGMLKKAPDMALPVKCAGLFSLASLSLAGTGHFSLLNQFTNPLSQQTTQILDTFTFRTGFVMMDIGVYAAASVFQVLITLISIAILFFPVKLLFNSAFDGDKEYRGYPALKSLAGAAIAFAVFLLIYLLPYLLGGKLSSFRGFQVLNGLGPSAGPLSDKVAFVVPPAVMFQWMVVAVAAAFICTVIAFLAGSFTEGGKNIRTVGLILLAAVTVLTVRPFTMSGFMTIRSMGMLNSYFAVIAASMFSAAAVWAFAAMRRDEEMCSIPGLVFGALGIFLIQTALVYSDGSQALLYLNKPDMSPILMYTQLVTMMQSVQEPAQRLALAGTLGVSGLMLSLPALLLFLLAKVLLPVEAMLAVIAGGKK